MCPPTLVTFPKVPTHKITAGPGIAGGAAGDYSYAK